jgi:hypothetical protein
MMKRFSKKKRSKYWIISSQSSWKDKGLKELNNNIFKNKSINDLKAQSSL